MWKILILIGLGALCSSSWAFTIKTKNNSPKLFYRLKRKADLETKQYITVMSDKFSILARFYDVQDGYVYWRTQKIKIKNKEVIEDWPDNIRLIFKPLLDSQEPKLPFLSVNIFASPISFSVLNKSRNINAGYSMRTLSYGKHELSHDFNLNEMYQESFGSETSTLMLNSSLIYDYNNFYKNFTYFAIMNYRRQKFNGDYPIKDQYGLGIAGLKYKFIKNGEIIKNLDLSYIPIYEELSSDFNVAYPGEEESKNLKLIRHSFRFRMSLFYSEWTVNYVLFYRPAYYIKNNTLDMQDIDLSSSFSVGRNITERIQLNFSNMYTKDIRLYRANGMRPDNTINSISINLAMEI
jgi:hypothetical protein